LLIWPGEIMLNDFKTICQLVRGSRRGESHAARLEDFYAPQADAYDDFRNRLLHGRELLVRDVTSRLEDAARRGAVWLDLGGGTGANIEAVDASVRRAFASIQIVDLTPSLLRVADRRIREQGWSNVSTVRADVTQYAPPQGQVDLITFSYSLTMIPAYRQAIDHALSLLKPGGWIGVVDFYLGPQHPVWRQRAWRTWFARDGVDLGPERLTYLLDRFETVRLNEDVGKVPYLMGLAVPYFRFVGRRIASRPTASFRQFDPVMTDTDADHITAVASMTARHGRVDERTQPTQPLPDTPVLVI
jgi:S-adenosylmethionine-diacylgycerolhomoserine-N-methlytransferase